MCNQLVNQMTHTCIVHTSGPELEYDCAGVCVVGMFELFT